MDLEGCLTCKLTLKDNENLQRENWGYRKTGCSNKEHLTLFLQLEEKEKIINEKDTLILQLTQEINSLKEKQKQFLSNKAYGSLILDFNSFATISSWIDNTKPLKFKFLYRVNIFVTLNRFIKFLLTVLQKGSEHSFSTTSFHSICDDKGPTLTIIKTKDGDIFGGYNSTSWNSDGSFGGDDKCFIFTLFNKHNIPPTMYKNNKNNRYVYNHPNFAATFGRNDITLQQNISYQCFPDDYSDTPNGKGKDTLTPKRNFEINLQDYEVFKVL
ncbi:hypothetical protein CYY_003136 [Polysphondylium violaceum]|uniref:TLDc domain-containing protein n=1 Tax=Polysphondylium violaceum TaxID=133409 RepID=A0A8J4PXD9_9MYCE|nr:hypothetical protein CYY_003136 [Polysphondylium violaceum]